MTKRFRTAAAVFALLTTTAPAHAALITDDDGYPVEVESLNLSFANNFTVTGDLGIGLGAPSVVTYLPGFDLPNVYQNGILVPPIGGPFESNADAGYLLTVAYSLTFPTLPLTSPDYGDPLDLTASDIHLDGMTALDGTVTCIANCG